jgi:hypothetical protein
MLHPRRPRHRSRSVVHVAWKEGPSHGALSRWSPRPRLSLLLTGCYGAYQVKADHPTGAGSLTPTVEDKDAGLVGLAGGLDIKAYRVIAVSLFPVTDLAIKDEGDRRLAASMSAFFQSELVRRLRESGLFTRVVNLTETPWQPSAEKALRLDGRITRLGEGSQAARAFLGLYWAGEARAQSDMTITDIQTEQPVIVTADRRVAQMGFFGGDSKDHLKESFDDMARDLARFLVRLSRGEAPRKE